MVKSKRTRRPRCRYCRTNKHVVPIVYGFAMSEEMQQKLDSGEMIFGGVARSIDAPNWHCKKCGNQFLR